MTDRPPRSEAYYLALAIAAIHFAALVTLAIAAWQTPFFVMKMPPKEQTPAAVQPAAHQQTTGRVM